MKNKFFTNEFIRFANIVLALAYIKKLALFAVKNLQTLARMRVFYAKSLYTRNSGDTILFR